MKLALECKIIEYPYGDGDKKEKKGYILLPNLKEGDEDVVEVDADAAANILYVKECETGPAFGMFGEMICPRRNITVFSYEENTKNVKMVVSESKKFKEFFGHNFPKEILRGGTNGRKN